MKINSKYKDVLKFLMKSLSGTIIYLLVRLSYVGEDECFYDFDSTSLFYLIYTTGLVFIIWELNDFSYKYFQNRYQKDLFLPRNIVKYQAFVTGLTIVLLIIGLYVLHFYVSDFLGCEWINDPLVLMLDDLYKSLIIALVFNLVYLNIVFIKYKRNADLVETKVKKENLLFKYESLRNQIDPHFLFNSFSVLNTLIQTDAKLATDFLNNLSDLYRYILDHNENNLVTLKDEMNCLDNYLFLMKIRHEGCIESVIDVEEDCMKYNIPTMSLQMLIENAIKHNSFNERRPLQICISIEDDRYVVVSNKISVRRRNKTSAGIGLENIRKRYEYYTPDKVVVNNDDVDFIVKLPLLKNS